MTRKKIELPVVGQIVLESADWEYKFEKYIWEFDFEDKTIDIDVHFTEISQKNIEKIGNALKILKKLDEIGTNAYWNDFQANGESRDYIDFWIEELPPDELSDLLYDTDSSKSQEERLLSLLRLVRIGFYTQLSVDDFIVMDYAFRHEDDGGFREKMLIVKLNEQYQVTEIMIEG